MSAGSEPADLPAEDAAPVLQIPEQEFLCIEYPGIIKNVDKAMETLGGIEKIQEVHAEQKRWLPLNFRPSHPFSHPIEGERTTTTRMVLKLKLNEDGTATGNMIGVIPVTYRFRGMAGYAYVPPELRAPEEVEPRLQSNELPYSDWRESEKDLHIPPTEVTLVDMPVDYNYLPNTLFAREQVPVLDGDGNVIRVEERLYRKRPAYRLATEPHMVQAHVDEVPTEPFCEVPQEFEPLYENLKRLFQERAVWAKAPLLHNVRPDDIPNVKKILPAVAYLFVGGPWRKCWVRLGYDPRKDPTSRIYQVIDFRVLPNQTRGQNQSWWGKSTFKPRRKGKDMSANTDFTALTTAEKPADTTEPRGVSNEYAFAAPPSQRQTHYQLGDVALNAVQKILGRKRDKYHKLHGWIKTKDLETIRDLMKKRLPALLEAYDNGTLGQDEEEEEDEELGGKEPGVTTTQADEDAMVVDQTNSAATNQKAASAAAAAAAENENEDEEDDEEDEDDDDAATDLAQFESRATYTAPQLGEQQMQVLQSLVGAAGAGRMTGASPDLNPADMELNPDDLAPFDILGGDDDGDEGW